jgi:hypothetical protein
MVSKIFTVKLGKLGPGERWYKLLSRVKEDGISRAAREDQTFIIFDFGGASNELLSMFT